VAQAPPKVPKVGYLSIGSASDPRRIALSDAFRQGLHGLGYIENKSVSIEARFAEGSYDRLPDLAAELVRLRVDIIVAYSTPATKAARDATRTIPIVMSAVVDPVATGLVASLGRPGGNVTGLSLMAPELIGKQMQLLTELVPKVSRVAVLASPLHAGEQREFRETQSTARALGITLQYNQVRGTGEVDAAFDRIVKENANALLVFPDPVTNANRKQIVEFAVKRRLPSMFGRKEPVEAGGLMSYGPSLEELYRRIPVHVDKILKGAKPTDVPTELPTKFEMFINLKTAKQIGLAIPPNVLVRADRVIR